MNGEDAMSGAAPLFQEPLFQEPPAITETPREQTQGDAEENAEDASADKPEGRAHVPVPSPVPVPVPARRRGHHRRVVRPGTELFEEDGSDLGLGVRDLQDAEPDEIVNLDDNGPEVVDDDAGEARGDGADGPADSDDARILSELPPHWGVYSERE